MELRGELLVEPFFCPEEAWLLAPEDWASTIVRGKRYDLQSPIGSRLWDEALVRLQGKGSGGMVAERGVPNAFGGYGAPVPVPHRIGQGTFRALVTDACGRRLRRRQGASGEARVASVSTKGVSCPRTTPATSNLDVQIARAV